MARCSVWDHQWPSASRPPNSTDTSKTPPQDEGFFAKVDSFFIGSRSLDTPQQASTKPPPILPIGDIERRSGLLILGKSGFGKSSLMVNLALEDVKSGHGLFFLDPHGEAIDDLLKRGCQDEREAWRPAESTVSGEDQTGQEAVCG